MTEGKDAERKPKDDPETAETPFQRFERLTQKIVSVPKTEIERRDEEWHKARKRPKS